jgi:Zn-dependent protease with chaperone function
MFAQHTLTRYIIAVIIVLAVVTGIRWLMAGYDGAAKMAVFGGGFLCGMAAMYIAMHIYRDNIWPWLSS